ncbi:MAG: acyltransferase [Acidocella sp.]|nr:acyltransferase [Acidocella sp.]
MKRAGYLDGLRGLACLQVVLAHYGASFFPHTYFGFVADGDSAVALFFLLSGFVLTSSFERTQAGAAAILSARVLRLAVPALLSVVLAVLLAGLCGGAALQAATRLHSPFLTVEALASTGNALPLRELSGFSLLFGYADVAMVKLPGQLMRIQSVNGPLWTMSYEIWGSAWIFLLVRARQRSNTAYRVLLAASVPLFGVNELCLFTLGHAAARVARGQNEGRRDASLAGAVLILTGVELCGAHWFPPEVAAVLRHGGLVQPYARLVQAEVGAVAVFIGVLLCTPMRPLLAAWLPRHLGRLSFSIYLLHFPVMMDIGTALYLRLGAVAAFTVSLATVFLAAEVFARYVDAPVIAAAARMKAAAWHRA